MGLDGIALALLGTAILLIDPFQRVAAYRAHQRVEMVQAPPESEAVRPDHAEG